MKEYVIIGNGVAGATAADKIRTNDPQGKITIFSEEPEPFYYRVKLPEALAGLVDLKRMTIHDRTWHEKRKIDLLLGEKAVEVDPIKRTVLGDKGNQRNYDALLLATGARCFIPPISGTDKKGVFALRTWADAVKISQRAEETPSAVLIGGGLLGLEAAYGLTRRGVSVSVVEFFDRLLPRQLCSRSAAKLQKHLEGLGFSFYLGARAKQILGQDSATGLALEDGQEIKGGLILFSAGIRPNLDLARAMGLETDKGVKVDERLMTSREGVWAAGDLIEHRGQMYGLWNPAKEQGQAAGINMSGGSVSYEGTLISSSLKVVGVDLTSTGDIDADGRLEQAIYEEEDVFRKIVIKDNHIAGYIFYGTSQGLKECQEAMEKQTDVSGLVEALKKGDFDFSRLNP